MALDKLSGLAPKEARFLLQFIRFARMDNGVYYARITPDNDVVALLMPDFADRYRTMPFLIHDVNRQIAGIYDTREWYLTATENFTLPDCAEDGKAFPTALETLLRRGGDQRADQPPPSSPAHAPTVLEKHGGDGVAGYRSAHAAPHRRQPRLRGGRRSHSAAGSAGDKASSDATDRCGLSKKAWLLLNLIQYAEKGGKC